MVEEEALERLAAEELVAILVAARKAALVTARAKDGEQVPVGKVRT